MFQSASDILSGSVAMYLVLFHCLLFSAVQLLAADGERIPRVNLSPSQPWVQRCNSSVLQVHRHRHHHHAAAVWTPCRLNRYLAARRRHRRFALLPPEPFEYAVVIDAGSSGSRIRVYRWPTPADGNHVELHAKRIEQEFKHKIEPGLSARANDLHLLAADIRVLLDHAAEKVPQRLHSLSPIYVMATAGMRLLLEDRTNFVMRHVDSLMRNTSFNPFLYRKHSTRILSGEEEGVFAWIAVNYLVGAFNVDITQHDGEVRQPLVGILELGGASTQIAFQPEGNIMAAKFPVMIGGWRYQLYVHSYLHYGQHAIDRRLKEILVAESQDAAGSGAITDPCMLRGDTLTHADTNRTFVGGSDPTECRRLLEELVNKVEPSKCHTKPCGIGSFYQPTIPTNMTFYAVGSFRYALITIGALNDDDVYVPRVGYEKAVEFCSKPLDEVVGSQQQAGKERYLKYLRTKCLVGLYTAVLFTRGYGFSNDTRNIKVVDSIKNLPLDWSLGAVLYEDELEAIYWCGLRSKNNSNINHQPSMSEVKSGAATLSAFIYNLFRHTGSGVAGFLLAPLLSITLSQQF